MKQPRWTGTGWTPTGNPVVLGADTLRGIRVAASNRGCTVVRARDHFGDERRFFMTERGWVEIERRDMKLMERAWA